MAKKKSIDSHLNKRSKMSDIKIDEVKVQTKNLVEPEVKLPCVNYDTTTPYSVLTQEFIELNAKTVNVPFSVDSSEFVNQEIILSTAGNKEKNEKTKKLEIKNKKKAQVKSLTPEKMSEITPSVKQANSPELSEFEILNRINELQKEMNSDEVRNVSFDVPKNSENYEHVQNSKIDKEVEDLNILNELQAEQAKNKNNNGVNEQINITSNELDELLKQLEQESGDLGIG